MTFQSFLEDALAEYGDSWTDVVAYTLTADKLASAEPEADSEEPFTMWTATRVYFPYTYDGIVYAVVSVPRNPSAEACIIGSM